MVYDVVNLVWHEFMQDRYGNGTIGKGSKECYSPVCAISTAKCYLVALYYTRVLKHDV
ncbi:Uncharacterised protein [Segatella copri]|nr:Uncharacterised protein [Segatella copri]